MTRRCRKCSRPTGPNRRICTDCSLEKRHGVPSDHFDDEDENSEDNESDDAETRRVECTACETEYDHDGQCACPNCGARRRRYIGPIGSEAVATDGGQPQ
ncbi:hypothetical protein [Natrarchaeobius oligotrophus]|uniref:Uncharacterized protein n=1 Tax=Natrarchaeobius chitinivorans TaxID=1679083 RepID=A0A3N6LXJ1_NATCH|nr:hypothetical protein [Natrarchaeobius chitinivorans]RQG93707.1 hypothetical protein EA472_22485 [Natrarchaeobius chitinivorans]